MTSPQVGRILRRSLTGATLILVVAGILGWTHGSGDGRPLLYAAAVILLGAVWETSRMGSLALRDLLPALLIPALGVLLLLRVAIEGVSTGTAGYRPNLALEYAWAGTLAACTHALVRALPRVTVGATLARGVVYVALGMIVLFAARASLVPAFGALVILLATSLPSVLRQPGGARGLAIAIGLALWLVPPLPALWQVWRAWSTGGLVALLLCAKIGDTAGYYVGTAIGRRHPFPSISPGKTVEGCLGSFAAGSAAGVVAVSLGLLPGGIASGLAAGAVVNLAAQTGDLLESWVKRRAGVKDSSRWFGPSGGVLDQIDSLLLAVPVAVATWPWILGPTAGSH
jgi:phosphatidate cytidylyltransferase